MAGRWVPGLAALAFLLLAAVPERGSAVTITGATVVTAPPTLNRGVIENAAVLVFAEAQGFTLTTDLKLGKSGTIAAGTVVDVYYVIFDPTTLEKLTAKVGFGVSILGFAKTTANLKKTDFLGNPGTRYDNFVYRGLETGPGTSNRDSVKLSADRKELNFDIRTLNPGDAVRVIVAHEVIPEPATFALFALGLGGLAAVRRRRA
jgi:PEP-CTERM motif